ncbi:hypothetical protein [Shinella zoogloeoides]|uniref:hypothetical protein n=1 Tax=Shinella zoogloeoides TaxID=352475 RepID=UPI00299E9DD1|nr:hypothetical protein [Shinella zoogloeoides]WPE22439.1 hypothetical protein ShzoTeo12_36550 [Shinella zoogloeoides]
MQSEKCKSCFECSETIVVKVRDERGGEWRDSSVRRCANDQCWHIVAGTREDRLAWISNVYDYKYFGDYELSPEQLSAVYEAKSLAALSDQERAVEVKGLEIDELIEEMLDAQQDINLAANSHMDQSLCDASALIDRVEAFLLRIRSALVDVPVEPVAYLRLENRTDIDGETYTGLQLSDVSDERAFPVYTRPPHREGEDSAEVERLTRPIVGIEHRTAQEVFDIMADRIRLAATRSTSATSAKTWGEWEREKQSEEDQ